MRKVRIGDVGEVITGKTPKTSVSEYYNGNFPFLTPVDFSSLKIIKDTKKTISQTGLESIKKCFIPKNSICVTCIGSDMGKVAVNMMDCATNQQINSVIPYKENDYNFIYYAIKNVSHLIKRMGEASTAVPIVNKTDFSNIYIYCPQKKEEQIAISKKLKYYDAKIETNTEKISLYSELIQSVYQKLFDTTYADDLSNDEIIKGWRKKPFKDFLKLSTEKIGSEKAPVYSATNNGITIRDEKFSKKLSKSLNNNKKIVQDDLIFGLSREILNFGVFKDTIGSVSPAYQIFKIDKTVILPFILELEIRSNMYKYMDILQLGAREGQGIRKEYLFQKDFLVPPMELQLRFEEIARPIEWKIANLKEENEVLAEIRDTLLPKLMSGELPVEVGEN